MTHEQNWNQPAASETGDLSYGEPYHQSSYPPHLAGGRPPATGGTAWGLGFLAYIPVPVLNALVALVAVWIYASQAKGESASATLKGNVRGSLNWHLTFVLVNLMVFLTIPLALVFFDGSVGPEDGAAYAFFNTLAAVLLSLWIAAGICQLVFCIRGLVKAARGESYRPIFAIPFLRSK